MENLVWYETPAADFNEAFPLGNGRIGAMVYGRTNIEKISLNHDTLWSGSFSHKPYTPASPDAYTRAQKLVLENRPKDAEKLLETEFNSPWTQSYLPLGNLYVQTGHTSPTSYRRSLDLQTATAEITYSSAGVSYKRTSFISYPDQCLCLRVESEKSADVILSADSQLKYQVSVSGDTLLFSGEAPSHLDPAYHSSENPICYDGDSIQFMAAVRAISDGILEKAPDHLICRQATNTFFYVTIMTNFVCCNSLPDKEYAQKAVSLLETAVNKGWAKLHQTHIADFSALYDRVDFSLDGPASPLSAGERLKQADKDLKFYELIFNFGRYLLISSSRPGTQATNLQGIWNEALQAPWSSNYTVNINTQMNYWPALICRLPECCQPLHDLISNIRDTGRQTAQAYYQKPGFVSHHNVDIWGHTTPVGKNTAGSCRFAVWNLSAAWFCRHLYEYYLYTQDTQFLKETVYPTLREAVDFYQAMLVEVDGHMVLSPSTSPENAYLSDGKPTVLAPYTTMTQSILMDLFSCCIDCCKALGIEDDFCAELSALLPKMNTFTIGSKGQLLEWDKEYIEEEPDHRHVSHLYSIYPGLQITPARTPELAQACRRTLELRGDAGTGWSLAWKMILWAHLFDGDHAAALLGQQLHYITTQNTIYAGSGGGTYLNLFAGHPPFQIDANFGITAGIAHLFLQYHDDCLYILPALPRIFPGGHINGLSAPGNITVNICWGQGKQNTCTLCSPISQTVTVCFGENTRQITLKANESVEIHT